MINFAQTVCLRLENDLPAEEYLRWIAPLKWAHDPGSGLLTLSAPTIFHQKRILEKYVADIRRQAAACGCPLSAVEFQTQSSKARIAPIVIKNIGPVLARESSDDEQAAMSPAHSFESFLTCPSNRLAALALKKFVLGYGELPAKIVFLSCSGPWGKTHLLNAAAARMLAAGTSVIKLDSEDLDEAQWARAEVIVADNVQLLEQRPGLQKRLIMAFDETAARRLRIIASAPASPVKLLGLSERLRSRLSSGLMLKIDPPEFELMKELAGIMAGKIGLEADEKLKTTLAQEARDDPRRLAGIIESAAYIAANTELDLAAALNAVIMDRSPGQDAEKPAMELIIETVAASFALKPLDLIGHSRLQQTAWPRRTAMYLARELTELTTSQIGSAFGGRDHSTVIHALKKISEEIKNPAKAKIVENIRRAILMGEKEAVID